MVYHEDDVAFRSRRIRRSCEHGLHTKMNEGCEAQLKCRISVPWLETVFPFGRDSRNNDYRCQPNFTADTQGPTVYVAEVAFQRVVSQCSKDQCWCVAMVEGDFTESASFNVVPSCRWRRGAFHFEELARLRSISWPEHFY